MRVIREHKKFAKFELSAVALRDEEHISRRYKSLSPDQKIQAMTK